MLEKLTTANLHLEKKWGTNSLKMGWTAIPTSLLFLQANLGVTPTAMNVLLNLIVHWWNVNEHPFPAQSAIAARMGVTKRTIQRAMGELENLRLIHRISTSKQNPRFKGRNLYDLSPLMEVLNDMTPVLYEDMSLKKKKNSITVEKE